MKKSIIGLFIITLCQLTQAAPLSITPENLINKLGCKTSGGNVTGGVGKICLNGLVDSVVVAQGKAMFESTSPKAAEEAVTQVKAIFPNAEVTKGGNSFMFEIK